MKGGGAMSVYESIVIMLAFSTFVVLLLTYVKK
ncbi:putative holin-like toxin [Eubacterium sp.]